MEGAGRIYRFGDPFQKIENLGIFVSYPNTPTLQYPHTPGPFLWGKATGLRSRAEDVVFHDGLNHYLLKQVDF